MADTDKNEVTTEEIKEALDKNADEEIVDAKIQAGLNEAAEEFKMEQEIENTGDEIAGKIDPVASQPEVATIKDTVLQYNQPVYKENKRMENNIREEAEIKTVYVKEKQRTGWWKVVMLILTILITITFAATALFAGIGAWQLNRIAENQEKTQIQMPGYVDPYYNGNNGGYSQGGNGGYQYGNGGYNDGYSYGSENDEDLDWNDIFDYFNSSDNTDGTESETVNGGNTASSDADWQDEFSGWLSDLFGGGNSSGNTQGF